MVKALTKKCPRVCQGDVFRDIEFVEHVVECNNRVEISRVVFPLVTVLTQDCDLEQDYRVRWAKKRSPNKDKRLFSVLVAPMYNAEHVYEGSHLSELGYHMQQIGRNNTQGGYLRTNQTPRYHYLEFPDALRIPPSVIDFKHYFSANVEYLKEVKRSKCVCQISPLYREDISQRFAAFLSRIGLPSI